jgi:2,3-dihydroxyphenylpropionate 1,2-dioxygenase
VTASPNLGSAYLACVPHVPLLSMQEKQQNPALWQAYDARVTEFEAFDPQVVIVFGGDHYSNIHLKLAPTFLVGHVAQAIDDCGGTPGTLDVPMALSTKLADALVTDGFDIATSYAMVVDHGFSNVLGAFLRGKLNARPVIPVHINSLSDPRPTMKRCRELGEAIGRWARSTGKRVAFLGSGGLSHQTNFIFPQYDTAPDQTVRDFIVHGGGEISPEKWHGDIEAGMGKLSADLVSGEFKAPWINKEWDERFLQILGSGDLTGFDGWTDAEVLEAAGYGGGEIRMWIAAAAAGLAAGAPDITVDYYSDETTFAVGAGVAHSSLKAA